MTANIGRFPLDAFWRLLHSDEGSTFGLEFDLGTWPERGHSFRAALIREN